MQLWIFGMHASKAWLLSTVVQSIDKAYSHIFTNYATDFQVIAILMLNLGGKDSDQWFMNLFWVAIINMSQIQIHHTCTLYTLPICYLCTYSFMNYNFNFCTCVMWVNTFFIMAIFRELIWSYLIINIENLKGFRNIYQSIVSPSQSYVGI